MAASAAAAPGSAERQARGGAASATGNAVSRLVSSRACSAGIWRAFGVPCLALVGSSGLLAAFLVVGFLGSRLRG